MTMAVVCSFDVPGAPVGKGRPRVTRGGAYTPERTRQYERRVALVATTHLLKRLDWRMDARYALVVEARHARTRKGEPSKKAPDIDNVIKAVADALEGIAYENDRQVVEVHGYTEHTHDEPRTRVVVQILGDA